MDCAGFRSRKVLLSLILIVASHTVPIAIVQALGQQLGNFHATSVTDLKTALSEEERAWLSTHPVLKVSGPRAFPPFHFFKEGENTRGMALDYLLLIMGQLGVDIEVEGNLPWPEVLRKAKEKEIDLISCAAKTPEREAYLLFSNPILSFPLVIISRKDSPFIGGLNDLRTMKVAFVRDNSVREWVERDGIQVTSCIVDSPLEALKAVSTGLADAHIENLAAASYLIERHGLANLKVAAPTTYDEYTLHFAVRKDWPELVSIINKAFFALTPEQHLAIRNTWLSVRYEYGVSWAEVWKWLLIVLTPLVSILMVTLYWNRRFRLEISQRKSAEEALRKSEERFHSLFSNMAEGVALHEFVLDESGSPVDYRVVDHNAQYEKLLHLRREDVVGRLSTEVYHTSEPLLLKEYSDVALSGVPARMEEHIAPLERHFDISVVPWGNKGFATIFSDISERKRAEAELALSEERFRKLFEDSPIGIALFGRERDYLLTNRRFQDFVGYNEAEVLERGPVGLMHPEDWEPSKALSARLRSGEIPLFHMEQRYIRKDGAIVWADTQIVVLRNSEGQLVHTIAWVQDITNRKQAEEERERLQAQLLQSQKMESVGRLAGGVAHDFNNMLGIILGHTEMALDDVDSSHTVFADLEEIRKAAERSADLVRQLLAFARKQTVAPRVLDLNKTVEGMLTMLRRLIGENIDLSWQPGENVWSVKVDPTQIHQILANLCVNAHDAIAGVGKITIKTGNFDFDKAYCATNPDFLPGHFALLSVSDSGCGMDKATLAKIFEPFFTTKEVGKGTGLGLATVYGIVKQNSGFIHVCSKSSQGTTFKIYLPRYVEQPGKALPEVGVRGPRGRGETLLLVEDETGILELTARMLERAGYTVLAASTPGEAMQLAQEHLGEIHLLVTDVIMPEMNGRDLSRSLLPLYPQLKALFMSGYTADVIARQGVLDPGVNFLHKPFFKQDLMAKVAEALGKKGENGQ